MTIRSQCIALAMVGVFFLQPVSDSTCAGMLSFLQKHQKQQINPFCFWLGLPSLHPQNIFTVGDVGMRVGVSQNFLKGEDCYTINSYEDFLVAAVFDGHGGEEVARRAGRYALMDMIREQFVSQQRSGDVVSGIKEAFTRFDAVIGEDKSLIQQGSTATLVVVTGATTYVANLGDSRCVVVRRDGSLLFTTQDHKPDVEAEASRVLRAGGVLVGPEDSLRLRAGTKGLSMTRALGDFYLGNSCDPESCLVKPKGLLAQPDVETLTTADVDFLIIASDGVWDILTSEEAASFVAQALKEKSAPEAARALLRYCAEVFLVKYPGYSFPHDDMTAVVMRFTKIKF